MSLLITMLPFYLLGNFHCMGMCGPLVMLIGRHPYRYCYFLGRLLSFTFAGLTAGALGAVVNQFFALYHLPALTCCLFGGIILIAGFYGLSRKHYPGYAWLSRQLAALNHSLAFLAFKEGAWSTFLFGFFTILLPCGQTLIVFSACALTGNLWIGILNGFAFAILTSPSLLLAMHTQQFFSRIKKYYHVVMSLLAIAIGALAICRGLAEMALIPHLILNRSYHIVIY